MPDETADLTTEPTDAGPGSSAAEPIGAQTAADPEPAVGAGQPDAESSPGPTASEAWNGVVAAIGDLGEAVAAWARAATDDPENRRHLDEVRTSVNDMARRADTAFSSVAGSDFGQQVRHGADDAGQAFADTAQKVSDAAAPHVATAFAGLADVFGRAAQKAGEAAASRPAPQPAAEPEPSATDETPDDAASSSPDDAVHE